MTASDLHERVKLSQDFYNEVLNEFDTVSDIESFLGWETVVDMWYFSNALINGDKIDIHDREQGIMVLVDRLPSKNIFLNHMNHLYKQNKIESTRIGQ